MIHTYYNAGTNEIYVDDPSGKTTTIKVPREMKVVEIADLLESDSLKQLLQKLREITKEKR